jgi:uncharacterized protein (TIGR02757 family)
LKGKLEARSPGVEAGLKRELEELYERFNAREFVAPDPLQFLYDYDDVRDREIVGLVASTLAYGNVKQIVRSVAEALRRMPRPAEFVRDSSEDSLRRTFAGFKHRFTTGEEFAGLLGHARRAIERHGSLEACFRAGLGDADETVEGAICRFAEELGSKDAHSSLVPCARRGSTCKRLNLYLRWMVRRDAVDPGGWKGVPQALLVIPLDVHMHRISRALGLTARKQPDMRTALEVTAAFRRIAPEDPVKYDFALTRLGIRRDAELGVFIAGCGRM